MFLGTKTGIISATGLTAAGNAGGNGAWLDACYMDAGLCTSTGTGSVSVSESDFLENSAPGILAPGLVIQSRGNITLNKVNASSNLSEGAELITMFSPLAAPTVNIYRSTFSDNRHTGLTVWSKGNITLNNVAADVNTSGSTTSGAWLSTSGMPGSILIYEHLRSQLLQPQPGRTGR